jgi:hypothetical protein
MKLDNAAVLAPPRPVTAMRAWRPAPFRHGPSPFNFQQADRRALGRRQLGQALFDHPIMELILGVSTTALAAAGTAKFDGAWRILSLAVLIAAGSQTLMNGVRYLSSSPPSGEVVPS